MYLARRVFLSLLIGTCLAPAAEPPKTVRLLTVGNSFSGNATRHLGAIAKANGDTLILGAASVGGASMELHWNKAQAFEKNPTDKLGLYGSGKGLKEELAREPWDFITFQQASIKSHNLETYRPFAKQLSDYLRQHAPKATLLLHQTWPYRADDPRFSPKNTKPGEPKTQEEMYAGLTHAYRTVAQELNVRVLPVGDAFHLADNDSQWGFRGLAAPFDPKGAKPGELPVQKHSLHVGWTWRKSKSGKTTLTMDGHHANLAGEYLGGCVWYEVLFEKSVENNSHVPKGLDPEHARFLRATAHRAVRAAAERK